VEEQTAGRIQDLLMPGVLMSDTVLVLTNAIYFKGSWGQPFMEGFTTSRPFQVAPGPGVNVPTMQRTGRMPYAETADVRAVELPYVGGKLAMLIIAPKADRAESFEAAFSQAALDAVVAGLTEREVRLWLPKFKFTSHFKLKPNLSNLGMAVAFGSEADFSGMNGTGGLVISDVIHQAFVGLDEKGTEAAAATAVVVGPPSIPPVEAELNLDRPFLFLIRDIPTGAVLFLGRLADPR
jgi:serpin B